MSFINMRLGRMRRLWRFDPQRRNLRRNDRSSEGYLYPTMIEKQPGL